MRALMVILAWNMDFYPSFSTVGATGPPLLPSGRDVRELTPKPTTQPGADPASLARCPVTRGMEVQSWMMMTKTKTVEVKNTVYHLVLGLGC
ncbi:hypothetical protein B0H65DRAFT_470523 [Neurospora tetraspora]|uniref:Questionable protein n=1 Tax=Neurospora tetraspora TaxID=94610 RepID=A0AAE0JDG9_9PEZI|nr:hypothetical protein B0H65DRAFT_470523 [Neurospora tetraspora]